MFNNFFFQNTVSLRGNVKNTIIAGQTADDNVVRRMPFACWTTKATNTH
jgi:hypothetical protein